MGLALNSIQLMRVHETGCPRVEPQLLQAAIEGAARSISYNGDVTMTFEVRANKVVIRLRPYSRLLHALSNTLFS